MEKRFEVLPHTADLKIRSYGDNIKHLFENALIGMFKSIEPEIVEGSTSERKVDIHSHDRESLLVDFLSEALYLSDVHKEAYVRVNIIDISDTHITCVLFGSKIKGFAAGEIKAVTHHDVKVEEHDGQWIAEVLFDL